MLNVSRNELHVWAIDLGAFCSVFTLQEKDFFPERFLPQSERAKYLAYSCQNEQRRFLLRRTVLRLILQCYTGIPCKDLMVTRSPTSSKPKLEKSQNSEDLRFNMSDSEDFVVIAVTRGREVGIDIEKIASLPNEELVRMSHDFFARDEVAKIVEENSYEIRRDLFFEIWAVKEATLKAAGVGLAIPLNSFSVLPNRNGKVQSNSWFLHYELSLFQPCYGYSGAIACEVAPNQKIDSVRFFSEHDLLLTFDQIGRHPEILTDKTQLSV